MSTSPDEAGALSPAERDFLQRRMPVETLAESYRVACDAAPMPPPANKPALPPFQKHEIEAGLWEARDLSRRLRRFGFVEQADQLFQVIESIREALK